MAKNVNAKIQRITEGTLVVGIDIAKYTHVARSVDWRGIELGKPLTFENTRTGLGNLEKWLENLKRSHSKDDVLIGMEPTGHYWMALAQYLRERGIPVVHVNPSHVKKSKELDDNSPTKNDVKDALTIARLVKDGRYAEPIIPTGVYAELRTGMNQRERLMEDMHRVKGRIHNWLDRFFPELVPTVFKDWDGKAALALLRQAWLPVDISEMAPEDVVHMWREADIKRGIGLKAAKKLVSCAQGSIGLREGSTMARQELQILMSQYDLIEQQLDQLEAQIAELLTEIPGAKQMLQIPGLGLSTVAGFLAEVGDLSLFTSWHQIRKLAGLNLKEDRSGMHKGQTVISKRGRARLRALLYRGVFFLVATNSEFKLLHQHYKKRVDNPLRPKQSLVALCGKLIRILYTVGTRRVDYDPIRALGPAYRSLTNPAA
ncbi:IS110 family transposase [Alicyclobacillus sp. SP_1]|uniref:IS110 family transposase n=1 Tax=Alicyclobacillus sp. SP_1 TaxID=2942475 RepID=UPI0021582C83|nr:IS110 family transposase [Alicyclobacillus sp. SP_1]